MTISFQNSTLDGGETATATSAVNGTDPADGEESSVERGYDRATCAILKVPCRFVSDHPCCDVSALTVPTLKSRMRVTSFLIFYPLVQDVEFSAKF